MPELIRSARKPKISILLTIDENGENGQLQTLDVDSDESSSEVKKKIGKRLIKKLMRAGDIDRKPVFYNSQDCGCDKQIDCKYDELLSALNGIVDRALHNNENVIHPALPPAEPSRNDDATHEELINYIVSVNNQLSKLLSHPEKPQPVKRNSDHDHDLNAGEDSNDYEEEIEKHPIATPPPNSFEIDYDDADEDVEVIEEDLMALPTKNMTVQLEQQFNWNEPDQKKFHGRLPRSIRKSTTESPPTTTTTKEYLLNFANNYNVDSEESLEDGGESENTTEAPTTESSQSTLEPSVTTSATEPTITTSSPTTENPDGIVDDDGNTHSLDKKLTISKYGIQIPLRMVRDDQGQLKFVLDRKAICSKCGSRRKTWKIQIMSKWRMEWK